MRASAKAVQPDACLAWQLEKRWLLWRKELNATKRTHDERLIFHIINKRGNFPTIHGFAAHVYIDMLKCLYFLI